MISPGSAGGCRPIGPVPGAARRGGPAQYSVTFTPVLVALLPAASNAVAVSMYDPRIVRFVAQRTENGAADDVPTSDPFAKNWTLFTPTLSDALAPSVRLEPARSVDPLSGLDIETVGGTVSEKTTYAPLALVEPDAEDTLAPRV